MTLFPKDVNELTSSLSKACEDASTMMASYASAAQKSNAALLQGISDMATNMNGMAQESFNRTVSVSKTILAAKTPQEAADTHAEFMKDCFDGLVAGSHKISELSLHLAKSAMDPLAAHANDAMGAVMKKAKAG